MTKKILLLFAILTISTSFSFSAKKYSLSELKNHGKFEITIVAKGTYSGKSIELKVKSNHKRNVELVIPTGTVFYTSDEGDQILIVVEEQLLVIAKGKTKKAILDGFCTEMSDGVPSADMAMQFMLTKREKLQLLANFINQHQGIGKHEIQEAVWCVSDNQSVANIYSDQAKKSIELKKFVAELTGQELTWHSVKRNHRQVSQRIEVQPVFVTGRVSFAIEKPSTIKSKITDTNGELIYENKNSFEVPKTNNVELKFNLSVGGWKEGTYYVIYYDQNNNTILKKAFTI